MKSTFFLRIAAVLTFIHAVLHTIGGVFGKVGPGPAAVAVAAMKSNEFLLMGHMRSFWDFYRGLGLAVTISLTAEAIVLWQLGLIGKNRCAAIEADHRHFRSCLRCVCGELVHLFLSGAGDRRDSDCGLPGAGDFYRQSQSSQLF